MSLWRTPAPESKVRFLFSISNKQLCPCCSAQLRVGSGVSCHRKAQRNSTIFHYIPLYIHYHSSSSLSPWRGANVTSFFLVQLKPTLSTLNNNIPDLFSMLRHLEPNKPRHFPKQELFLKTSGWTAVFAVSQLGTLPPEPALDAPARSLTNLSVCLRGVSPALQLAWSSSGVPEHRGFGLTVSVTARVTSPARSPSAVTAPLFLLGCKLRLVFCSRWPLSSVSENGTEIITSEPWSYQWM